VTDLGGGGQEPPLKICVQLTSGQMGDTALLADPEMVVQSVAKC